MTVPYAQALANLTEANVELGLDPRAAFIQAFSQVLEADADDVRLLAE